VYVCVLFSGVFRNQKGGGCTRGVYFSLSGVHFQKCSNFTVKLFFTLNIGTYFFLPQGRKGPRKYAHVCAMMSSHLALNSKPIGLVA